MIEPTWQSPDGSMKLWLGDCLEVAPQLEPGSVNTIVTSPPYNQMAILSGEMSGTWVNKGFVRTWKKQGYPDSMDEADYQKWQNDLFEKMLLPASENASLFYNHQLRWRRSNLLHPVLWFHPTGWTLRQEIIWDRGNGVMFSAKKFNRTDERILWFDRGSHKWNQTSSSIGSVWRMNSMNQNQGKLHPVEYPIQLPLRCIVGTTDLGDTVLDPFMGSGSTGVACIRAGVKFNGIEREPKYFEMAVKRITSELKSPTPFFRTTETKKHAIKHAKGYFEK